MRELEIIAAPGAPPEAVILALYLAWHKSEARHRKAEERIRELESRSVVGEGWCHDELRADLNAEMALAELEGRTFDPEDFRRRYMPYQERSQIAEWRP